MSGRVLGVLLVALPAVVAGCSGSEPDAVPGPSTAPTAAPSRTSTPTPAPGGHPCKVDPPMPNPKAPAYGGRGPHLVAGGVTAFDSKLYTQPFRSYYLPASWRAPTGKPGEDDSSGSQLSVCKTGVRQTGTKPVGACKWDFSPATKVYPATYSFSVYETRTGRLLSTFSLAGDIIGDYSCPQGAVQVDITEGAPDVAQDYDFKTIETRLRSIVLTTAR